MKSGIVLLMTDRPDRSEALRRVVDHVADCVTVTVGEIWIPSSAVIGAIVDANLSDQRSRTRLRDLRRKLVPEIAPVIYLTESMSFAALHEAKSYGANLCLPFYTEPSAIVAALVNLISPNESLTDLTIRRASGRAGQFFKDLFSVDTGQKIDMSQVKSAASPVLDAIRIGGLTRWLDTIWTYDDATFQHCLLVAGLMAAFSQSLGLSMVDQRNMTVGALVHDVGKTKIPKSILNKPGRLTVEEMSVMRTHAAIGHSILVESDERDPMILTMTRHHHEMLDGSGYPDSLRGDNIADSVRLLTICDIYAALIERRPYKSPYPPAEAMQVLNGMENKLERGLVQAFGTALANSG